jgi:hypothetical protein
MNVVSLRLLEILSLNVMVVNPLHFQLLADLNMRRGGNGFLGGT